MSEGGGGAQGSSKFKYDMNPPDLNSCRNYEHYKNKLRLWKMNTRDDIPKERQGCLIVSSLPDESKRFGNLIQETVINKVGWDNLEKPDGLAKVEAELEKLLGKHIVVSTVDAWKALIRCKKQPGQTVAGYVREFEAHYGKLKASGTTLPSEILGVMLMEGAGLSSNQEENVRQHINLDKKEEVFDVVKNKMLSMLGDSIRGSQQAKVKDEPGYDEAMAATRYRKPWQKNGSKKFDNFKTKGKVNPKGSDGKILRCNNCDSVKHLFKDCPHEKEKKWKSRENKPKGRWVYLTEEGKTFTAEEEVEEDSKSNDSSEDSEPEGDDYEVNRYAFFTTNEEELNRFTKESLNSAALDTGCTSNVSGKKWMAFYLKDLPEELKKEVDGPFPSNRSFVFGNNGIKIAKERYVIPADIAGKMIKIVVDVVDSDIPLLLSKREMKKWNMVLDMGKDKAYVNGKEVDISITSAGHYIINLLSDAGVNMAEVYAVDLKSASKAEKVATIKKLHKQFGHRPRQSFVNLLKSGNIWSDEVSQILDDIMDGCDGCIKRRRNPDRPAVTMPMAADFNEKVAMDLKYWNGQNILYIIDMFSRFTVGVVIPSKKPKDVINALMKNWVCYFGIMGSLLTDNGGEFVGEEWTEALSMLNVIKLTTGAESPWQNGLCEKNHALADNILTQISEDYPNLDIHTQLAWACNAKNSLMMVYGYSPYQIVFGSNPRLPNIITDPPQCWENETMSQALNRHLEAMKATRQAFIKSESCARMKRALKSKIRTIEREYKYGDIVTYKREGQDRWLGPAKVIFQDSKVIFLRHGSNVIRVSANRLLPAGKEMTKEMNEAEAEACNDTDIPTGKREMSKAEANSDTDVSTGRSEVNIEIHPNGQKDTTQNTDNSAHNESVQVEDQPQFVDDHERQNLGINLKRNDVVRMKENGEWHKIKIISRAGKKTGKYNKWYNIEDSNGIQRSVNVDEVEIEMPNEDESQAFLPADEEIFATMLDKDEKKSPECQEAKKKELDKLIEFNTYEIVDNIGQESISTTWVLTKKGSEIRARLVARGFEEEDEVKKDSPTVNKSSLRLMLTISSLKGWEINMTDIKSAFLQGSQLDRDVFIKPPKEAEMEGKLWKLNKCLYGLRDASRQWYLEVENKLISLGFRQNRMDSGLFFLRKNQVLIGVFALHVDDFLHAGNTEFENHYIPEIMKHFQVGKTEKACFTYTGFDLRQDEDGVFLDQGKFVENIEIPTLNASRMKDSSASLTDEERSLLRKMVGSINWAVRATRPDVAFNMIELSTKFQSGQVSDLGKAKNVLLNLKKHKAQLRISNLRDLKKCQIRAYTDAALGNLNNGVASTAGWIVFIINMDTGECAPIDWRSNKVRRVVSSSLAAEVLALSEGLEAANGIKDILVEMLGKEAADLQIHGYTDNKTGFGAVYSDTNAIREVRTRREVCKIREMIREGLVQKVKWVPGTEQLADILTKKGKKGIKLLEVIQEGKINL